MESASLDSETKRNGDALDGLTRTQLFDNDEIEVGSRKFRYNCVYEKCKTSIKSSGSSPALFQFKVLHAANTTALSRESNFIDMMQALISSRKL